MGPNSGGMGGMGMGNTTRQGMGSPYGGYGGGMGSGYGGMPNYQGGYGGNYGGGVQSQGQWNQQRPWDPNGQGIPQMGNAGDQWLPNYGSATPQYYNAQLWAASPMNPANMSAAAAAPQAPAWNDPANTRPIGDATMGGAYGPFGMATPTPVAPTDPYVSPYANNRGAGTGAGQRWINDPTWSP